MDAVSGTLAPAEEQVLVARAKSGDQRAFEALVRYNADRLYAVVLRFSATEADAEEATQEAFVRAWRILPRLRSDSGSSHGSTGSASTRGSGSRSERWRTGWSSRWRSGPSTTSATVSPGRCRGSRSCAILLGQAVRRLPEKYRAPVILRDIEGLTTEEAAEVLGLHQAAFKSRLHRRPHGALSGPARLRLRRGRRIAAGPRRGLDADGTRGSLSLQCSRRCSTTTSPGRMRPIRRARLPLTFASRHTLVFTTCRFAATDLRL